MKQLLKDIELFDKALALQIAKILEVKSAVIDDATLVLIRSDDFSRRLKGIKSLLHSFSIDLLSKTDEEKQNEDLAKLIEKRMKIVNTELKELMKIVRHLKGKHRL